MANQNVSNPTFYIDFVQLAKAKGFFYDTAQITEGAVSNSTNIVDEGKNMNVWYYDYTNPTSYSCEAGTSFGFKLSFWDTREGSEDYNIEMAKLFAQTSWAGIINHNIKTSFNTDNIRIDFGFSSEVDEYAFEDDIPNGGFSQTYNVNNGIPVDKDGYSIVKGSSNFLHLDNLEHFGSFNLKVSREQGLDASDFKIGSIAFGKRIQLPHSPDLNVRKSVEYDGVKITKSLKGADFVQVNHQGQPDWLVGEPWTLKDYISNHFHGGDEGEITGRVGRNGRRVWNLSYSQLSNDDVFYDLNERVVGGQTVFFNEEESQFNNNDNVLVFKSATNEVQQIWDLTLGGSLSFLFNPGGDEFAICKLDTSSFTATQVANHVWNINMKIVEVW